MRGYIVETADELRSFSSKRVWSLMMRDRCLIATAPLSLIISGMNTCFNSLRVYYYCALIFVIMITVCCFMRAVVPLKDLVL